MRARLKVLCMRAQEVKRKHARWLRNNQHIRYMWIPYSNAVVVVTNNPVREVRGIRD